MKVAVIGLGLMGGPMADHLCAGGHDVQVYDPVPAAVAPRVDAGAVAAPTAADAARGAEVVCVVVRDDAQALGAVTGPAGVLETAAAGTVVAVHSTVAVATVRTLDERCRPRGVHVVDAGISGGIAGATAGTLYVMCGGNPAHIERARPVMECFAAHVVRFGELGAGMAAKLARNLAHYAVWTGLDASRALADAAGIDRRAFTHLVTTTGIPALHELVLAERDATGLVAGEQTATFVELGWKDLDDVIELGEELGVDTTIARAARLRHGPSMGMDRFPLPAPPDGPQPS